ncbi:sensor histidine kinase [Chachezhania sediminis]|uniref:sensor histidine kinase n=1 Tax=Chachezhania sediminis TaxID=2599291 RepID=UPI00131BFB83|nr:histidine kinase [Chachezhania sediminis]
MDSTRFPAFWRNNAVVWVVIGLFGMALRAALYEAPYSIVALTLTLDTLAYAYTGVLHLCFQKLTIPAGRIWVVVLIACIAGLVAGLGQMQAAEIVRVVTNSFYREGYNVPFATVLFYGLIVTGWTIAYFWLAANAAVQSERLRSAEAQTAALRAELQRLQTQLDPHFLFNALNAIATEIPEDAGAAVDMTHAAADVLRDRMYNGSQILWSLADEIDHLRDYLRLQYLRYDKRLDYRLECDDAVLDRQVPRFMLQELVENAIKYGQRGADGRLLVDLSARLVGDALEISVRNCGRLRPEPGTTGAPAGGLGLVNLKRRLDIHYPDRHRFEIRHSDGFVVAVLRIEGIPCFA